MVQNSVKKFTKYLVCVSAMVYEERQKKNASSLVRCMNFAKVIVCSMFFVALSSERCFADDNLRQKMLNFIVSDRLYSQAVGVFARKNATPESILVNYKELAGGEKMDVLELYIDDENSFYVINRYFFKGSSGRFEGIEKFYRTDNARQAVNNFFDVQGSSIEVIR
jgi:hypothetical protein